MNATTSTTDEPQTSASEQEWVYLIEVHNGNNGQVLYWDQGNRLCLGDYYSGHEDEGPLNPRPINPRDALLWYAGALTRYRDESSCPEDLSAAMLHFLSKV